MMVIRVTVWGENVHEQKNKVVAGVYPLTMHGTIAAALNRDAGIRATTVTLRNSIPSTVLQGSCWRSRRLMP